MENNKIESDILEFINLEEDMKNKKIKEIESELENLDIYKLMNIIYKFSNIDYVGNNINDLLELLKDKVTSKLKDLSLIKVIDLYIELFNKSIIASDTLMASKNVLAVMSYNITSDSYIERELSKKKVSKEEYLSMLKKDLDKNVSLIDSYTKIYKFLDDLQDKILVYIEVSLETIDKQEKEYLILNINKRFSDASLKLLSLKNNLDKIKKLEKNELINTLEYNDLKNSIIIYESFRNTLLDNKNDKN